jgi:hypothetical protein
LLLTVSVRVADSPAGLAPGDCSVSELPVMSASETTSPLVIVLEPSSSVQP